MTAARDPSVMRLIDDLRGGEPGARKTAATALADLGAPAAQLSRCLLSDQDPALRAAGARALGAIANPDAVAPLIAALGDATPEVKEEAAKALGALRSAKAVDALIVALRDANLDVRVQAAAALGLIRDPRAVAPLVAVLGEKSPYDEGRIGARVLFAEDSGAQVGAVLDSAYEVLGLDLNHTAAAALEALTGEKLGGEPAKWQEWLRKRAGKA
jgi:HEAT repeat protein